MVPVPLRTKNGVFIFRLGPTVITGLMLVVLIGLGSWQVHRLNWKEGLIATIDARLHQAPVDVSNFTGEDGDYRPATATGTFLNDKEIFMVAISLTGEGGYHVLTPLRLKDGRTLLVDRGWVPYAALHDPNFFRPAGEVTIQGVLRQPQHYWMQPTNHPEKNQWYAIDLVSMAKADKVDAFLPYVLEVDATPNPGGYPVGGQTRVTLPNNHLQYALTWYALAGILLVIYLVSAYRKPSAD